MIGRRQLAATHTLTFTAETADDVGTTLVGQADSLAASFVASLVEASVAAGVEGITASSFDIEVDTTAVAYETEVTFTVKVSGSAAAAAVTAQLADTSANGPMRAMLASAGVETTDATFDAAAASAAAAGMSTATTGGVCHSGVLCDRFGEDGTWLNPSDASWWEKLDVTGSTVPEDKPLPITRAIQIKKTTSGALKISDTGASTFGGWDACAAVFRIRAPRNRFWVPRNFSFGIAYYRISPGLQITCLGARIAGVWRPPRASRTRPAAPSPRRL